MAEVSGAGPAEKREKPESPMNCGHSYWSSVLLMEELVAACALTVLLVACKVGLEAKSDETRSSAKITIA